MDDGRWLMVERNADWPLCPTNVHLFVTMNHQPFDD